MCGRVRLDTDWSEIVRHFDVISPAPADFTPRYNAAPTDLLPVIAADRSATMAHWGFVPFWEKGGAPRSKPINAMAETVATTGMFRGAFAKGRCVVPATGFYEWETTPTGKRPVLFAARAREPLALAGVCSWWRPSPEAVAEAIATAERKGRAPRPWLLRLRDQGRILTYAVITTTANAVTGPVHDRMPVVLPTAADMAAWLAPDTAPERLQALLGPAPDTYLEARLVNPAMGSVEVDTPEGCAIL